MSARRLTAAFLLVLSASSPGAQNRLGSIEVELQGPLSGLVLDAGEAGSTRLEGALVVGERRTLELPLPVLAGVLAGALSELPEPGLSFDGGGSASLLRWSASSPDGLLDAGVAPALLAATRPPLAASSARARAADLLLLGAGLLLTLACGRRSLRALCTAACAALLLLLLPRPRHVEARVAVVEAQVGSAAALSVEAGLGRIEGRRGLDGELRLDPAGVPVHFEVSLSDGSWSAHASRARLYHLERSPLPSLPDAGGAGLLGAWLRRADGLLEALGVWPAGTPQPDLRAGSGPPGWLLSGLPMGLNVLLGLYEGAGHPRWLRIRGVKAPKSD